jgi:uroporphyrinogen decarboxylase
MPHDSKALVRRTIKRQAAHRVPLGELCLDDAVVSAFTGSDRVGFEQRFQVAGRLGLDLICLAADYGMQNSPDALPAADTVCLDNIQVWSGKTDLFVFLMLDGGFQWGIKRWGFQQFLTMAMRQSTDVAELLEQVERLNHRLIKRAADLGADGVVLADDIAYQQGLLLPPDQIRTLFLPSLARQAEISHTLGLPVFFHSDGNLGVILGDIACSGFDGLQGIESAAGMDLAAIQADFGTQLCFWGNLDPAILVETSRPERIAQHVEALLAAGARDGGLIFGTSSGLFKGMQLRSIEWAYRCARQMGNLGNMQNDERKRP